MLDCYKAKRKRHEPILYPEGIGGREVCNFKCAEGRREYYRRVAEMFCRQFGMCTICGHYMRQEECTFEHQDGRGFNGGHRDDRIEIDGKPYNSAAHGLCNVVKGSVRLKNFKGEAA